RAERVGGAPTVPARWLARLELAARQAAGAIGDRTPNPLAEGAERWLAWAAALDPAAGGPPPDLPAVAPPVEARFRDLSVSDVERWVRDPYGHYARHILRLYPLEAIDQEPDAADRGNTLHHVLHAFVATLTPGVWPEDAPAQLLALGEQAFAPFRDRPGVHAFWWHRFCRMAGWYAGHEAGRWPALAAAATERELRGPVSVAGTSVDLRARLDRLDRMEDGGFVVIDYKSGSLPALEPAPDKAWTASAARAWSPQLPLEGMLVLQQHAGADLEALEAWAVGGGRDTPGEAKDLTEKTEPVAAAEQAWAGLERLLAQFADPTMPYLSEPRPLLAPRYSDYRHLARTGQDEGGDA
ncbi:MAG: PD-(D/E)XK nuclease family protein, partial [Alphaproteobacteria bacterium]|nr:PD-(D/E)XK nuclease family protein [Alphaproteobacteria bacterium]